MNEAEKSKYLYYITSNDKDEKNNKKLKNTLLYVVENRNKKSRDFQKAVKKFKNDENFKFIYPLIERHFLFKAAQEINEELTKNIKILLIDFSDRLIEYFKDQTMLYCRINGHIDKDETLGINFVNKDFYYLYQV